MTRDEKPDGPLSTALREAGLSVVYEPVLERRVVNDAREAITKLGPDDWLVLTSIYAIEAVAQEAARVPRVAVVGKASRRAAQARGFRVELLSPRGDGGSLIQALQEHIARATACDPGPAGSAAARISSGTEVCDPDSAGARIASRTRVCYPRSALAQPPDPWPGIELLSPVLYETIARTFDRSVFDRVDVVSVTSPSAVDAIRALPHQSPRSGLPLRSTLLGDWCGTSAGSFTSAGAPESKLRFASIGPTTSAALRQMGIEPWIEAPDPSFKSLARAIADGITDRR